MKNMSFDDDTCTTSDTSFTFSTTTPAADEDYINDKGIARVSLLQKRIESLEHENKELNWDLSTREDKVDSLVSWCESQEKTIIRLRERGHEVTSLLTKCESQEKTIIGLRDAEITKEKIDQLCDEIKSKDGTIGKLNEELKRTRLESLEEKERVDILNCEEIRNLKKTAHDLTIKTGILDDDVVKLNSEIISKNEELEKKQKTIISMTKLRIDQAQKLVSIYLKVSSMNRIKKDQSNKIAALQLEIDEMRTIARNEAIVSQENIAKLDELEQIIENKDEIIKEHSELCSAMEQKLSDSAPLKTTLDLVTVLKKESQFHQEKVLLLASIDELTDDHMKSVTTLKREISQMKIHALNKAIAFQENVAKFEQLEKSTAKKDETINQQKECCYAVEKKLVELIESARGPPLVDDGDFCVLENQLELTKILATEMKGNHSRYEDEDEELLSSFTNEELYVDIAIDERKIYFGGEDEVMFLENIAEIENTINEVMDTIEEGKSCFTDMANKLVQSNHNNNAIVRQKNKLEDDLKQSNELVSKLQEASKNPMEELIVNAMFGK